MALHIDAAKRLLEELEEHAVQARAVLDRDGGADFIAVIDARDRILAELTDVVDAIARERTAMPNSRERQVEIAPIFADMARAAAAALESQQELTARAAQERNRLAAALHNTNRPDSVASHYAASGSPLRPRSLSVTG
jgi:signal transduction histidine kinase